MDNPTSSIAEIFTRNRLKHLLVALAVALTVFSYYAIVEAVNPNQNFLTNVARKFFPTSYEFWSGSPGGFYIEIGKNLEDRSRREPDIDILNREGSGGQWNLDRVSNAQHSMGLTQWDTLNSSINQEKKKRVRAVGPLYSERLHILYDVERWETYVRDHWEEQFEEGEEVTDVPDEIPRLIIYSKEANSLYAIYARGFFAEARVAIGPPQSGTQKFAQGVLITAALDPAVTQQIGFQTAFEELTNGGDENERPAVVFTIAGAPLPSVKRYLETQRLVGGNSVRKTALASIDPEMVQNLIQDHQFYISSSGFRGYYPDNDDATTFSADAYLIASLDVTDSAIEKTLELIVRARADIRSQLGISAGEPFQLEDTSFYERFKAEHDKAWYEGLKELLVFVVTVVTGTVLSLSFILWLGSSIRKTRYLREIATQTQDSVPKNFTLREGEDDLPQPIIYPSQVEIVGRIIRGISRLVSLENVIQADHASQLMTDSHFLHVSTQLDDAKALLRENLARRFHQMLATNPPGHEKLLAYHTAGYLTTRAFDRLTFFSDQLEQEESQLADEDGINELTQRVLESIRDEPKSLKELARDVAASEARIRSLTKELEERNLIFRQSRNRPYQLSPMGISMVGEAIFDPE
ncbi:MAG: hypothetical protein AAF456_11575 [Planctomycetota bacterium]